MLLLLLLQLLFLALMTPSASHRGLPLQILREWTSEENTPDDELDELYRKSSEDYETLTVPWSTLGTDGVTLPDDENLMTTTREPLLLKARDEKRAGSAVWKAAVVVGVLLVSVAGCLSAAYYMCVWRGGRIYYRPHRVEA